MVKKNDILNTANDNEIHQEIKQLIANAQQDIYHYVNYRIMQTYWTIDKILYEQTKISNYGDLVLKTISKQLTEKFQKGFTERNLRGMRQFYN